MYFVQAFDPRNAAEFHFTRDIAHHTQLDQEITRSLGKDFEPEKLRRSLRTAFA